MSAPVPPVTPLPPWGDDALSHLLSQAQGNTRASAQNLGSHYSQLVAIHDLFLACGTAIHNTPDPVLVARLMLFSSGASWLAGVRVGLGGQTSDVYPCLRAALEYAGYAAHMTEHPELQMVWLKRGDSPAHTKSVRQAFTAAGVAASVAAVCPAEASEYSELYDKVIGLGAHPNQLSLASRLEMEADGTDLVSTVVILTSDPRDYFYFASHAIRIGALCLSMFARLWSDAFVAAGVTDRIAAFKTHAGLA
jgi:hypothetical protein